MKDKKLYINTIGCQMNVYDSGQMAAELAAVGYVACETPERADLVLVKPVAYRQLRDLAVRLSNPPAGEGFALRRPMSRDPRMR